MKEKKNVKCTGKRGKKLWNIAIPYFFNVDDCNFAHQYEWGLNGLFSKCRCKVYNFVVW